MEDTYHVVIVKRNRDIMSRPAGNDFDLAVAKAKGRREDFPYAYGIAVVHIHDGLVASL